MRHKHSPTFLLIFSLVLSQLCFARNRQTVQLKTTQSSQTQKKSSPANQGQTSIPQDIRDDPANCNANLNPGPQGSSGVAGAACPSSPIAAPTPDDSTFVVDCGGGLDTGCTFRSGGPLVFNVQIKRFVGNVALLKANGLISTTATIQMPAFDVDFFGGGGSFNPERDRVSINGHVVPGEFLQGDNNIWRLNEFTVPIEWVNFAQQGVGGGATTPGDNIIRIDIDTANVDQVWCTAIDWAAINFRAVRPVVFVHGILSDGSAWNKASFSWVNKLNGLGIPNNGTNLSMGALDSIQNNSVKISNEVANFKQRWGVDKVNLVCHSKGGLDSRHFVENNQSVERLIQLGTPNAGSPLADIVQGVIIGGFGIPGFLVSGLAAPAGYQLTRPHMNLYNTFHGHNPKVKYTALAGDYNPNCAFFNPFCRPLERLLLLLTGRGDTIVPISSVHALSYTENRTFASSGNNKDATHTVLNGSAGVYNSVRNRIEVFGARPETVVSPALVRTASLPGSIQQGQVQTKTLRIDQATSTYFMLMYPSGNLDLALISPSGERFDATTVQGNPNVARQEEDIEGGRLEVYNFATPEVGTWSVEVSAPTVTEPSGSVSYAVSGLLENAAISFAGADDPVSIHVGQPLKLSGTLKNNGTPLTGGSVSGSVLLPNGTMVNVPMFDNATHGDPTANDGVYTGTLTNTATPGTYRILLKAKNGPSGSTIFSREEFTLATVSQSSSTITGPFSDSGSDTDGDGLFNKLVVQVGVNATVTGSYRLAATLADSLGNSQPVSALVNLNQGANTVPLEFDGATIFGNRVDGPYTLSSVTLAEEGSMEMLPVDRLTNAYQTPGYNFHQFQHGPIVLTGNGSTQGIDLNANALFDQLKVGIEVETSASGLYNWSGRLTDRNGKEIGFAAGSASFNAGLNTLDLTFEGMPIGQNGVNGPYFVQGLLVFGGGQSLIQSNAFTTSSLNASQFEGFVPSDADLSVTATDLVDPIMLGQDISYHLVIKNNGPDNATGVVVTDHMPSSSSFVSATPSVGSCSQVNGILTCQLGNMTSGAQATIELVVKSKGNPNTIFNTAMVVADQPDPALGNNNVSESTRLVGFRHFAFAPSAVTGGCQNALGQLWLSSPAPAGVTINFSDNSSAVAPIPSVTTIGGETSIQVTAVTSMVNAKQVASVTATTPGGLNSIQARLQLLPVKITSLTLSPNPAQGGTNVTGTVSLTCAAPQQIIVRLLTNKAAAQPTVSQIVFNVGDTSKTFTIRTRSTGVPVTAIITALDSHGSFLRSQLTINP